MCCYNYYVIWMSLWADIIMCCYDYYVVWMLLWADICAAMTSMDVADPTVSSPLLCQSVRH